MRCQAKDPAEAMGVEKVKAVDGAGTWATQKVMAIAEITCKPIKQGGIVMPGFNQRGPMNEGPMTGRRRGDCARGFDTDPQSNTFTPMGMGNGKGRKMGRRAGQGPGGGQGYGRMGMDSSVPASEETLKLRVQTLETELDAIRNELTKLSNG